MLILCEKPSVAREFAHTLGCEGKKGYYEKRDTVITYCVGHLFELCVPEAYNSGFRTWRREDLPIIPEEWRYEKTGETAEQTDRVVSLIKDHAADEIVIATDAGREGELIARIVLKEAGIRDMSRCRRFWVSEALTREVIMEGMAKAKPLKEYDRISRQGYARQHADWLVGINLTRYMSVGNSGVFSVGRVQTAVLSAIAGRNEEVKNFVSRPYEELEAEVKAVDGKTIGALLINPKTGKAAFTEGEKEYLEGAEKRCLEKPAVVGETESVEKVEKPERLLNITGLQKKAYKQYGYTPEKTLGVAQALYDEHKCLSYPRTPSRVMGDNNVELFREKYEQLKGKYPDLSGYSDPSLINGGNKHLFNSAELEDHHALIPLRELPEGAMKEEREIYEIVIRSFFTACMPDYQYTEKRITFRTGGYTFQTAVKEVRRKGWKASVRGKEEGKDEEIPEASGFDERECRITGARVHKKKTGPRKEYSIDTLLAFMENPRGEGGEKLAGLGTPATRAEIIKAVMGRGYVEDRGKKLYATEKGQFLLRQMNKDEELKRITDAGQTTEWEKELEEDPEAFERHIKEYIGLCIKSGPGEVYEQETLGVCPVCGNRIVEGKKSYYCLGYKTEKGCKFCIWKETAGAAVSAEDARQLLGGKATGVKNCATQAGKKFRAALKLERGGVINLIFQKDKKKGPGKR